MIEIMETLQQYIPIPMEDSSDKAVHQIVFGGDQLTAAHSRGCAELRINSDTSTGRLKTLIPGSED